MKDELKAEIIGSALTWRVGSVEAAVELAERLKQSKRYDWFRGQRCEWPPTPSLGRLQGKPEFQQAYDRLVKFLMWLRQIPELHALTEDIDSALAIAQHYGIPTTLLDFTTDPGVAGYFASGQPSRKRAEVGCIYCINTRDFKEFWASMRKCLPYVRKVENVALVRPRVPNLWRLEAQHGVFLYAPTNWFELYPPDRILFPQKGMPPHPTAEDIIPTRKSQMEIILDRYFMSDAHAGFTDIVKIFFPEVDVHEIKGAPKGYEFKFFTGSNLTRLPSWHPSRLRKWRVIPVEAFRETVLGEIVLKVDLRAAPEQLRQQVAYGVRRALSLDTTLRGKSIRWLVLPQKRLNAVLTKALDWYWNGVRLLPYTNQEIADGVGMCFALHRIGFGDLAHEFVKDSLAELLGNVVEVQFGSLDGSFANAYVAEFELRAAVRSDIKECLTQKYRKYAPFIRSLLQICYAPERLFDFTKLAKLFVTQIAPMQVIRPNCKVAYFSPAQLKGFGLP